MLTIVLMQSIFIILMGYFTNPFKAKMYLLSFLGMDIWIIIKLITSTNSQIKELSDSINEPVWVWVIGLIYFMGLFMIGRCLASMDKEE